MNFFPHSAQKIASGVTSFRSGRAGSGFNDPAVPWAVPSSAAFTLWIKPAISPGAIVLFETNDATMSAARERVRSGIVGQREFLGFGNNELGADNGF